MGKRTKDRNPLRGKHAYVKTMMRIHRIKREIAEKWWTKCQAGYHACGIVKAMRAVAQANAPQSDTDSAEQVIPFTGTHPNEDDSPDAA